MLPRRNGSRSGTESTARRFLEAAAAGRTRCRAEEWREAVYGKLPALNKAILDFAFKNYGKKVEDGLCGQLVVRALQEAGGQLPKNETTWGQRLPPAETALPGDIVILEKARFRGERYQAFADSHAQIVRLRHWARAVMKSWSRTTTDGGRLVGPSSISRT